MNKNKKYVLCAIMGILVILVTSLISYFDSLVDIEDAAVNNQNGDIAYLLIDDDIVVRVYNKEGKFLYGKRIKSHGGIGYVYYTDEGLNIYSVRGNRLYIYNERGDLISEEETEIEIRKEFADWEKQEGVMTYKLNGHIYTYKKSLFPRKIICYIIDESSGEYTEIYNGEAYKRR